MNSDRWKQVDSLLQSVLERQPEERSEFLRRACAGDEALEREVRVPARLGAGGGKFPGESGDSSGNAEGPEGRSVLVAVPINPINPA